VTLLLVPVPQCTAAASLGEQLQRRLCPILSSVRHDLVRTLSSSTLIEPSCVCCALFIEVRPALTLSCRRHSKATVPSVKLRTTRLSPYLSERRTWAEKDPLRSSLDMYRSPRPHAVPFHPLWEKVMTIATTVTKRKTHDTFTHPPHGNSRTQTQASSWDRRSETTTNWPAICCMVSMPTAVAMRVWGLSR